MPLTPLSENELDLVRQHLQTDPAQLALRFHGKKGIDGTRILQQLVARQKARTKLPAWYAIADLFFPAPLSVEQASSQATALYKASLISGDHLADLTMGMGVDSYYFSDRFDRVSGFEINPELAEITSYNIKVWGKGHCTVYNREAPPLQELDADWIYIDPSRRDAQKKKIVAFENSSPNVLGLLPVPAGKRMMIKSSPLIDIVAAVEQLKQVAEVHVVGYRNECKELLFVLDPERAVQEWRVSAVVVDEQGLPTNKMTFTRLEEETAQVSFSNPLEYLYEPHPAFMKSGGFHYMAQAYGVNKIAPSSHLYTSENLRTEFPGRLFKIMGVVNAAAFSWKDWLEEGKANLTLRNFPATPDDLRKKWRLKEGGQDYLFATTLATGRKVVIVTKKAEDI